MRKIAITVVALIYSTVCINLERHRQSNLNNFLKKLINHHIINGLIDELETTREKLKKERTVEDRSAFDRLQEMTSFDFAVRESTKLENELP